MPAHEGESIFSEETLRYIGYNDELAARIWHRWCNWSPGPILRETDPDNGHDLQMPFIEFATGHAEGRGRENDTDEDDDEAWRHCMNASEISEELQDAIMDPVFKPIRLTQSCSFWVLDTMEMRYRNLEADPVFSAELDRVRGITSKRSASVSNEGDTALSTAAMAAQDTPGCTVLYKGVDQTSIDGLLDSQGNIDGLEKIVTTTLSDFIRETGIYFYVDRHISLYQAAYAKRRGKGQSVAIVQLTVPNSAIENLPESLRLEAYWPSAEWKSLILRSRRGKSLPTEMEKFKYATLIIGNAAKGSNNVFRNLESPEEITERMVLKTMDGSSRNAVQYAWRGDVGWEFLEEHGKLRVFLLTSEEYDEWYEQKLKGLQKE